MCLLHQSWMASRAVVSDTTVTGSCRVCEDTGQMELPSASQPSMQCRSNLHIKSHPFTHFAGAKLLDHAGVAIKIFLCREVYSIKPMTGEGQTVQLTQWLCNLPLNDMWSQRAKEYICHGRRGVVRVAAGDFNRISEDSEADRAVERRRCSHLCSKKNQIECY